MEKKTYTDTISVPQLIPGNNGTLYSVFTGFSFCRSIADGKEAVTYPNGNKRTEGGYKNDWPANIL